MLPPVQPQNDSDPAADADPLNDTHVGAQGGGTENSGSNTAISPASSSSEEISAVTNSYAQESAPSRTNTPARSDAGAAKYIHPGKRAAQTSVNPLAGTAPRGATRIPPAKRVRSGPRPLSASQASATSLRKPLDSRQSSVFIQTKGSEDSFLNAIERLPPKAAERLDAIGELAATNALDALKDNFFGNMQPNDAARLAGILKQWNQQMKQNAVLGDDNGFPKLTAHVQIGEGIDARHLYTTHDPGQKKPTAQPSKESFDKAEKNFFSSQRRNSKSFVT